MKPISLVYVTTPTQRTATSIGRKLVEEGLVACANIVPGMKSIYRWKGKVEEGRECILLLKTGTDRVKVVAERVQALHPFECPCVVSFPLQKGSADYFEWVWAQSRPVKARR